MSFDQEIHGRWLSAPACVFTREEIERLVDGEHVTRDLAHVLLELHFDDRCRPRLPRHLAGRELPTDHEIRRLLEIARRR